MFRGVYHEMLRTPGIKRIRSELTLMPGPLNIINLIMQYCNCHIIYNYIYIIALLRYCFCNIFLNKKKEKTHFEKFEKTLLASRLLLQSMLVH